MVAWTAVLTPFTWALGLLEGGLVAAQGGLVAAGVTGGSLVAVEVGCGLGLLWKVLGTLLFPVLKSYVSRAPVLGFLRLLTLRRTELQKSALDKVDKILRKSLPLRVTRVYIHHLRVSVGPVVGVRVNVAGLRVELELTPHEAWEAAAEDVQSAVRKSAQSKAKADIKAVEASLKGKGPVPSAVAAIVESFIRRTKASLSGVEIVIRGQGVPDIAVSVSADLRTSRCRAIERNGAQAQAQLRLSVSVGGSPLLSSAELELKKLELPRVMRTLLMPRSLPAKKANAEVIVKRVVLEVRPSAVNTLMQAAAAFKSFSGWKGVTEDDAMCTIKPLVPAEIVQYEEALSRKEDVTAWEERMTADEILSANCECQGWPVPEDLSPGLTGLRKWVDQIKAEKNPVQAAQASVEVQCVLLEVLSDSHPSGHGLTVRMESFRASVGILAPQQGAPSLTPRDLGSWAYAVDSKLLREAGPKKLEANAFLGYLEVTCAPPGSLAVPVLEPCSFSAACRLHASADRDTVLLRAETHRVVAAGVRGQGAVAVNISGHAMWQAQNILMDLADAAKEGAKHHFDEHLEERKKLKKPREAAKRRAAYLAEVGRIFDDLDADDSGFLEFYELEELLTTMYGSHMTLEEIKQASKLMMQLIDDDNTGFIDKEELQHFFEHWQGFAEQRCSGPLCPELSDFVVPVPAGLDLEETFCRCVCPDFDEQCREAHPEVLQLRWVRALQNYKKAQSTWMTEIAPKLDRRFGEWRLKGDTLATDFWNDPTFSFNKLNDASDDAKAKDVTLVFSVDLPDVSLRLADCQHASAIPRITVDVHQILLAGGVETSSHREVLSFRGLSGGVEVSASYWNHHHRLVEPVVEPWSFKLDADGQSVRFLSDHHMVLNATPPLLQALSAAAASFKLAGDPPPDEDPSWKKVGPNIVRVLNRTLLDVRVSARVPFGACSPVEIGRAQFDEPVVVVMEEALTEDVHNLETSGLAERWTVAVQGTDAGDPWQIDGEIGISVTSRKIFQDVARQRFIMVDVSVDVHRRAPLVTLSGICSLNNITRRTLVMTDPTKTFRMVVGPGESRQAGVGGGFEVTMNSSGEGSEPSETKVMAVVPKDSEKVDKDSTDLFVGGGYKLVLLQRKNLVHAGPVKDRVLVCVPMLRVLNGMPCRILCGTQFSSAPDAGSPGSSGLGLGKAEDSLRLGLRNAESLFTRLPTDDDVQGQELLEVASGDIHGLDDVDPDQPIKVKVGLMSPHRETREHSYYEYVATIPKGAIHDQQSVRRALGTKKYRRKMKLESADEGAPRLEIDLVWEGFSAMVVVYAVHWLMNKSGWEIEAHCGQMPPNFGTDLVGQSLVGQDEEIATAGPLSGDAWAGDLPRRASQQSSSLSSGRLEERAAVGPDVAFLRASAHKVHLRLHGRRSGGGWAWDAQTEGAELQHWTGLSSRHPEGSDGSPAEGAAASSESKAWESGWSDPVLTEVAGTTGEAHLPEYDNLEGGVYAGGSLGVSISELPPPFLRSRLITVTPRYVVRNDLDFAVRAWPRMGSSRRVPVGYAPADLPLLEPGGGLASLDCVAKSSLMDAFRNRGSLAMPLVSFQMVAEASRLSGATMDDSDAVSHEDEQLPWSVHTPLSVVGDVLFTVSTGNHGDPYRVVRASVQQVGATMFVVLVKGKYDYIIRNRSLEHTVAFYQEGSLLKEDFAILKPCTYRAFTFPDPDAQHDLRGRILGAGSDLVVKYDMDDTSRFGRMTGLTLPGKEVLLDVDFNMTGGQRVLSIKDHDPQQKAGRRPEMTHASTKIWQELSSSTPKSGQLPAPLTAGGSALNGLHVDVFLAGFHVCLVDTSLATPQELLGVTVDYVQIEKVQNEKVGTLEVHNLQIDEFGEGRTIFGPAISGLNSQNSPEAELVGFKPSPLLKILVMGPRRPKNPLYDTERQIINLQNLVIDLQALKAPKLDVGRMLSIALRLESWTKALDLRESSNAKAASNALRKAVRKGLSVPRKGGMLICYIGRMVVKPIVLEMELVLKKRSRRGAEDQDDEDDDLEYQLLRLSAGLSPGPRAVVSFVAKLATTFAEASPRFKFSKLDKRIDPQNSAVLVGAVGKHYINQLQWQAAGVLGSLQVLGDPAGLFLDVTGGFEQFFVKSVQELQGERGTVGSGVHDLVGGTVGGVLGSVATMTGAVKDTLGTVAGGPVGEEKRAETLGEGIEMSLASVAGGCTEALTGLVERPLEGWDDSGALGFVKGSAQGVIGVVARPIEGILGAAEKLAQGAEGQVRGASNGYGGLRRPPRADFGARGVAGLQTLHRAFFCPKWRLRLVSLSLPDLWTERRIRYVTICPAHEGEEADSNLPVMRAGEPDCWVAGNAPGIWSSALDGASMLTDSAGERVAEGRVGCLRGPFRIQVVAAVEGNLQLTSPFKVVVGQSDLNASDLDEALRHHSLEDLHINFDVRAVGSPIMGKEFSSREGEVIGSAVVCLSACLEEKIMPMRLLPDSGDEGDYAVGLAKLGPAAAVKNVVGAVVGAAGAVVGKVDSQISGVAEKL